MNATLDFVSTGRAAPDRRQAARIAAGVAASIALHVLLLAAYRQPPSPPPAAPPDSLTVRLRAAPPPVPVPDVDTPAPRAEPAPAPARKAPRGAPARRPSPAVIAVDPALRQSDADSHSVDPAPAEPQAPAAESPRFDLDAARRTARSVANEPDPARAGTALERLPPPALQTENKFERAIKSAKRRNCKDGVPGGLLAPLFLAMDKKDSGCKW